MITSPANGVFLGPGTIAILIYTGGGLRVVIGVVGNLVGLFWLQVDPSSHQPAVTALTTVSLSQQQPHQQQYYQQLPQQQQQQDLLDSSSSVIDQSQQYQPGTYPQLKRASLTNIPIYENIDGYPTIPNVPPPPPAPPAVGSGGAGIQPPPYTGQHNIVSNTLTKAR